MKSHTQSDPSLRAGGLGVVHTTSGSAGALSNLKRLVFVAALLLALVGGAGQASASTGKGGAPVTTTITHPGGGHMLTAGVTWED